jgi:glycosyltransferase involved in cell wall biosynthesis
MADRRQVLFVATVYTHLAAFHIPFMVEAAGVVCHDIPFARSFASPAHVRAYRALRALLARERYALIHVHTPAAAWLTRLAARLARQGPVLYTAHGFHFYKGAPWPYWLFYYPAERIAARWTDGLIVMNSEDLARAHRMGFLEGENLFFVHGVGVDIDRFRLSDEATPSLRRELGLGDDEAMVVCVAEFTSTKNHAFLLETWKKLVREDPRAHLLLVGDGRLREVLSKKVASEGVPRVHFLGYRRDVPQLLRAADIVVLPSRREGLPRAVMEAMAAGKPVVATNVRGSRDLVEDGVTGLLVEVGDVRGLAEALLRLLRDEGLRRGMGQAAQAKVQDYALDRVLEEMAAIYARYLPRGVDHGRVVRSEAHGARPGLAGPGEGRP